MTFKNLFFALLIFGVLLFTVLVLVSIVKEPHDQAPLVETPPVTAPPVTAPTDKTPTDKSPTDAVPSDKTPPVKTPPATAPKEAPAADTSPDISTPNKATPDKAPDTPTPATPAPITPAPSAAAPSKEVNLSPKPGLLLDKAPIPYAVWNTTRLPGEKLGLKLPTGYTADLDGTAVTPDTRVPSKAGTQILTVKNPDGSRLSRISVFTLEPASAIDAKGWLNGYRIGTYPENTPRGFIRLDSDKDKNIEVAPHFKLGQFLCKQQPEAWPKYVLVTQNNLKRLETLRESLVKDNITDTQTFFVMSGFRTPFYNTAIGSAKLSRHMYGDAADIYVDVKPRDGNMDDLNGDGVVDKSDSNYLYDYASKLFVGNDKVQPGGLGAYKANAVHGPFVHVDGRGHVARWGR